MPGSIFLVFIWGIWIFATFLMEKNEAQRLSIAIFAFAMIICLPLKISINGYTISAQGFIVIITCYSIIIKQPLRKQVTLLFCIFSLVLGYTGMRLFEMYDPILMIVDRRILVPFLLIIVSYFLYPYQLLERAIFICLGVLQGEILLAIILSKWEIPYLMGSLEVFDILSITFFVLMLSFILSKSLALIRVSKPKKVVH